MSYPAAGDKDFQKRITELKEFAVHRAPPQRDVKTRAEFLERVSELCDPERFEKAMHQHLIEHYLSVQTPYRSLLLYHALGSGKTCASVAVAEALLRANDDYNKYEVWIIVPQALRKSYQEQVFQATKSGNLREQCTGDSYLKLVPDYKRLSTDAIVSRVRQLVKNRYRFFTYDSFATHIETLAAAGTNIENKLMIVDEAHNIRIGEEGKRLNDETFLELLRAGTNNRLILLSATPMFDSWTEIGWLLELCAANDKRPFKRFKLFTDTGEKSEAGFATLSQMAQEYISYVKGGNPFVFAARLSPQDSGIATLTVDEVPTIGYNGKAIATKDADWLGDISDGLVVSTLSGEQERAVRETKKSKSKRKSKSKTKSIPKSSSKIEDDDDSETHGGANEIEEIEENGEEAIEAVEAIEAIEAVEAVEEIIETKDPLSTQQQATNIAIGGRTGESAILSIFAPTDTATPLQFRYSTKPASIADAPLHPNHLSKHSAKIAKIVELVGRAKGVVLIYSQFIWSGVVPIAFALEHLGWTRYKSRPLLHPPTAATASSATYAIISGKRGLMSPTNDDIRKAINATANADGSVIKVLLLSPIGSEGFSFRNVREMHILDPWYHLNRNEQVIGRAIRTCSHVDLPIEERNVTVFLHATKYGSVANASRTTPDMHAYRLAANKKKMVDEVNATIEANAMDCNIQKNINYIPATLFKFDVVMSTSQGALVPYHFGDTRPEGKCVSFTLKSLSDVTNWSPTKYQHLVPTVAQRMRRYVDQKLNNTNQTTNQTTTKAVNAVSIDIEELLSLFGERDVAYAALKSIIDARELVVHQNKLYVRSTIAKPAKRLRLVEEKEDSFVHEIKDFLPFFRLLAGYINEHQAMIELFSKVDVTMWNNMAKLLVKHDSSNTDPVVKTVYSLFKKQGLIIDITSGTQRHPIRGYVDIFTYPNSHSISIYENAADRFRDATAAELSRIRGSMQLESTDESQQEKEKEKIYGIFVPHKSGERFEFKLMLPEDTTSGARRRRGVVCKTLKKHEIQRIAGMPDGKKEDMCYSLAAQMLAEGRLLMPPLYKPKK